MSDIIIQAKHLAKTYSEGSKLRVQVLRDITITIKSDELIAIVGPSGSGKSTLLHLLGGLDQPTHGEITLLDTPLHHLSEVDKSELRNKYLGFVYQFHHLLPEFTALENVAMPLLIGKCAPKLALRKAAAMLERVGLKSRMQHLIGELSGGERQRVAIARALVTSPQCVLADEPTGNLDQKTAGQIYELLLNLNRELHTSFVIVTHDLAIAAKMQRVFTLDDGMLKVTTQ